MKAGDEELIQDRIQQLWENTDFSSTLFESLVGYAVIAADFDGNIIAYNQGAAQIYGYSPEEIVGKRNIETLFPRDFEAAHFQRIVDVLLSTGRFSYECEKVRKGGAHFPAQVLFTLTKDKTGKVVGFVEIVQDLTQRKRAEEELRNHRDNLEVLVTERTAELANTNRALQTEISERKRVETELRQQARELAEADRRKNEFLAMLAHELRNPLAPISAAAQVMRQPDLAESDLNWARGVVERQVDHLARLVDDLLDVSRITRGKIQLRKEQVDLAEVVGRAVETSRPLIDARGHQLTVTMPATPLRVEGDPVRLGQVMSNLLNNAAKFTEERGHIWLSGQQENGQAVVRVRDTGIGMSAEMLPQVFELFAQADRSLDRSQGGLGIGLTLVKTLVEKHHGSVEAHSAGQGQGSEFVVRLPLLPDGPSRQADREKRPSLAGRSRRILLVDDNLDTARIMALLLQSVGHEVRTVHDGSAALEAARAYQPEVILLDIGLPVMDGYVVAKRIREQPVTGQVFLVAMTGYGEEKDRRRSLESGFDHHLVKPVKLEEIEALLASLP